MVAPYTGARIETFVGITPQLKVLSRPTRARELKHVLVVWLV
ncbi:hypothetical protein GCWU000246_00011 [Jonquetella anthropi E3_33 E1]|nr:hypothetical protein GCWU000246_00011 [Jonquetella anthropi E3_33 E1]